MFYTNDPLNDFRRHDAEQQNELDRLPKCDICDRPIQDDHYYQINGDNVCPECLDNHFRKDVDLD